MRISKYGVRNMRLDLDIGMVAMHNCCGMTVLSSPTAALVDVNSLGLPVSQRKEAIIGADADPPRRADIFDNKPYPRSVPVPTMKEIHDLLDEVKFYNAPSNIIPYSSSIVIMSDLVARGQLNVPRHFSDTTDTVTKPNPYIYNISTFGVAELAQYLISRGAFLSRSPIVVNPNHGSGAICTWMWITDLGHVKYRDSDMYNFPSAAQCERATKQNRTKVNGWNNGLTYNLWLEKELIQSLLADEAAAQDMADEFTRTKAA